METEAHLNVQTHFRLKLLYLFWAAVLIGLGTVELLPVIEQIGSKYGGFIWTHDPTREHSFYVSFDLWRSLPPSPDEIRFLDEITTVNGRSPWEFDQVYDETGAGELVTYVVQRGDERLIIREHVRIFTGDKFFISYGLLYLAGLSYVFSGYALIHRTARKDFVVFSFAFLLGGGAWFSHSGILGIHTPYVERWLYNLALYTPAMPLAGAILLHFSALYPTPKKWLLNTWFFPGGLYAIAFLLIAGYTLTRNTAFARVNLAILIAMFLFAVVGMISVMVGSALAYLAARRRKDERQQRIVEPMILVSLVGVLIFAGLGMLPVLVLGYPLVPFEIWITLVMLLPLVIVYALSNAELIDRLFGEVALRQQYGDQVQELQNIRERTLHEVSDALHDHVIPELRGLHFAATAAQRQASGIGQEALSDDLLFISDTLNTLSREARSIMEGAKPVDWEDTELSQALHWLTTGLLRRIPGMAVKLDVEGYDENDGAVAKDALYWITRATLSNVQDHALATKVTVSLHNSARITTLRIVDNGVGFDVQTANQGVQSDRRHLGLANMRLRAREINARLFIDSQPGAGTRIEVTVPRGDISA